MQPIQLTGPDGLLRGVTWSPALIMSIAGVALVGAVVIANAPALSRAVMTSPPDDEGSSGLAALLPDHVASAEKAQKRFSGRYLFYPPPAPKPPPQPYVPPPPVKEPEVVVDNTPKVPATYEGKKPSFFVGDTIYFSDSMKLRIGEEADGITFISADAPWSVKLGHKGGEYDVPIVDFPSGNAGMLGGDTGAAGTTPWLLPPGHAEEAFMGLKAAASAATPPPSAAPTRGPGKVGEKGRRGEDPAKDAAKRDAEGQEHADGGADHKPPAVEVPPALSQSEIEKMDRPTALAALSKVSRAKGGGKDLDEPTKKRLEEEFKQLMDRVKATAPPPGAPPK